MIKKSGAAAILLLVIMSFTVGSVSPAASIGQDNTSGTYPAYGYMMSGKMALLHHGDTMPPLVQHKYTRVILDLSGQETVIVENASHPHGLVAASPLFFPGPAPEGNRDYIAGTVIVLPQDSNAPWNVPVKFYKHPMPNGSERPFMVSYRMEPTTFKLNDSSGSDFTFGGEILVANGSIVQNNITATPASVYDNLIAAGQTNWHQAQVSGTATAFNVDLKWNDTNDDMSLTIYTPDGHILGPYTDSSDGKTDGRINMEIDNSAGVADGTWYMKVSDTNVTGIDDYYISSW